MSTFLGKKIKSTGKGVRHVGEIVDEMAKQAKLNYKAQRYLRESKREMKAEEKLTRAVVTIDGKSTAEFVRDMRGTAWASGFDL